MMTNIVDLKAIQTIKQAAGLIHDLHFGASDFIDQLSTVNLMLLSPDLLPKAVESMLHYKVLYQLTQPTLRSQLNQQSTKMGRNLYSEEVIETIRIHNPDALRVCMK